MRRVIILGFVLAPFLSGCSACTFPFSVESGGTVIIPLGAVGDNCDGGGTVPDNGEPDENGNLTTYTHTLSGTAPDQVCNMNADWAGRLVDMVKAREDTETALANQGLDPETIEVNITNFVPVIQTVFLADDGADGNPQIDIEAPALIDYIGTITVGGSDIITAEFSAAEGDTDPANPRTTVNVDAAMLEAANAAYDGAAPLQATGTGGCNVDFEEIAPVQAAAAPAVVVDFKLTIEGEGALGGG